MNLEIKEPCHEDWDKMKIGLISRHCDSCEKAVMDFTTMNRAQIITYLLSNPNDNVCGRLKRDQFDFHHQDIPILIETLKKEKHFYDASIDDYATSDDKEALFVERVEALMSRENTLWITTHKPKEKE